MKIKTANACYTGGNIYIYYGQLKNGLYFRACDDWDWIEICDADTSTENADYMEFYEEHGKETISGTEYENFWNDMLLWIIHNAPDGNYNSYELEKRMIEDEKKKALREMKTAVENLKKAWMECNDIFSSVYIDCNDYIVEKYPFNKSFDEMEVVEWAENTIESIEKEM